VNRAVKLIASLLVTLVFTWWAFRDTDWQSQVASLKAANYLWVVPYFAILTLVHVARTLRWGCLLSGLERVPFRKLNEASGIGFMMLLVLPFRLGEFARPFLIAQRSSIRRSAAMTSVVLERITDGMSIAVLMRVLLFFVPAEVPNLHYVKLGANLMFAVFGGGLAFLLFAVRHQSSAVHLVRATVGRVSPGMAHKMADIVDTFVGAMRQLPDRRQMALFFLYTAVYWAMNGAGMALLSRAFGLNLSLFQAYVLMSVLVVGVMIPSAPGMVGLFQAAIKVGLSLFVPGSVVNSSGLAYANVLWLCQTVQQIGFGLVLMSRGHLSFKDLAGKLGKEQQDSDKEQQAAATAGAPRVPASQLLVQPADDGLADGGRALGGARTEPAAHVQRGRRRLLAHEGGVASLKGKGGPHSSPPVAAMRPYLESRSSTASRRYSLWWMRVRRASSRSLWTCSMGTSTWVETTDSEASGPFESAEAGVTSELIGLELASCIGLPPRGCYRPLPACGGH
jgi:hypothetical protein